MIPDYSESNSYHIYHHVRKSISFSFCIDILYITIHITEKGIKHISKEKKSQIDKQQDKIY